MNVELLFALQILHPNLVEIARPAAHRGARLDTAGSFVRGQVVRGHLLRVVNAPGDDRVIRVTADEVDDDLLADARNVDEAPLLARPWLRDANPATAILVLIVVAIPIEMHLNPTVFVGVNLLSSRTDDHRRLRATR